MTINNTHALNVTDIDCVLPAEYEVLQPGDQRNENRTALRAVCHDAMSRVHYFYSAKEYFKFAVSIVPRTRLLAEEAGTRYVQFSASYDADPYFQASVTHTVAAFTQNMVVLHRMKSDETSVRFELSRQEMAALLS